MTNPSHWKKGQSGNPNGRPPGKNIMSEVLKGVLAETFMTTTGENPRDITRLEMLMKVLVTQAERGDKTCLTLLMRELRHIDDRDAIVNSPAEEAMRKQKEASESLIRKMREFRTEHDPEYRARAEEKRAVPETEEKPEDGAQAEAESARETDNREPPDTAASARQSPQEASPSLIRKMREFRAEHDPQYRAPAKESGAVPGAEQKPENGAHADGGNARATDSREPANEPPQSAQEASDSPIRKMRAFCDRIEAEERAAAPPKAVPRNGAGGRTEQWK